MKDKKKWLKRSSNIEPDVHLESKEDKLVQDSLKALELLNEKGVKRESVLEAHEIMMSEEVEEAGFYRSKPVYVGNYKAPEPEKVRRLMEDLMSRNPETHQEIYQYHLDFEKIHPFIDGNGRLGRVIYLHQCLKNNLEPVNLGPDNRNHYYYTLRQVENPPGTTRKKRGRGVTLV
jgi:Fic family protein